ncbi:hypothetical protein [Streptomyces sp. NPDC057554]|uniref:hypothetical protein n=1 Tax=Streptomyces sp. NPDC057554 TaxID=3350538 RepID=UPI00368AE624
MPRRSSADRARRRVLLDAAAGLWPIAPYPYPVAARRPARVLGEPTPESGGAR